MNEWQQLINGFDFQPLLRMLYNAVPALICITLHELSHGWVALKLGDPTAKNAGRLTLNPIKHIDIFGFLMLVVAHVGWAKPVPINMRYFRHPKRDMALTALAGPVSNFLITLVCLLLYGFFLPFLYMKQASELAMTCFDLLYWTAYLSLGLALFNLLPIPPLDGSKVLFSLIPDEYYMTLMRYERYGMILLIVFAFTGVTGQFLPRIIDTVFDWFLVPAQWVCDLSQKLFFS